MAAGSTALAHAQPSGCAVELELSRRLTQEVDQIAQSAGGNPGAATYAGFFQQYQKLPVNPACPQIACALTHAYNQYVRQLQLKPGGSALLRESDAQPFFAACPAGGPPPLPPPPIIGVQGPDGTCETCKKGASASRPWQWAAVGSSTVGLALTVTGATLAILNNQKAGGSTCIVMASAAPCAYDYPAAITGPLTGIGAGLIGLGVVFDLVALSKKE